MLGLYTNINSDSMKYFVVKKI